MLGLWGGETPAPSGMCAAAGRRLFGLKGFKIWVSSSSPRFWHQALSTDLRSLRFPTCRWPQDGSCPDVECLWPKFAYKRRIVEERTGGLVLVKAAPFGVVYWVWLEIWCAFLGFYDDDHLCVQLVLLPLNHRIFYIIQRFGFPKVAAYYKNGSGVKEFNFEVVLSMAASLNYRVEKWDGRYEFNEAPKNK